MGETTGISWTDMTLNFWHGCLKVSPGCQHCYAETLSKRYGRDIWGPASTTERMKTKGPWRDILKWDKAAKRDGVRRKVFCASMSDFFEEHYQLDEWRDEAIDILSQLEWLDVQLLTKRPENVMDMVPVAWRQNWPAHIWIGTSVENQETADKRIPELLKVPAGIRFLSCEPLLSEINNMAFWFGNCPSCGYPRSDRYKMLDGGLADSCSYCDAYPDVRDTKIHWVIIGGESGHHARPMQIEWAQSLVDQCQAAGVAVWMKQLGGHPHPHHDMDSFPVGLRVREFPG